MSKSTTLKKTAKILFLADTHLGFDLPLRPKIKRRRRGHDFFRNYHKALQPALSKHVDLVVHGGDLFFRKRVHSSIVERAFQPLLDIADRGVPVILVPGNHERSTLTVSLFEQHPLIYIFWRPETFIIEKNGIKIALSGFPFIRHYIDKKFQLILDNFNKKSLSAD